ncbi:flavin reductase family protein [Kineosporia sp. NBRC 101731]|uniref:flavin reductase family protein n=1 Tax=Kineosporia sp. NBRC 101731 TaxID=3032199 RepID=UPI0024A30978|nr:flavin reductase family protein [Kineosporia sp. NBRC 101731]GLY29761.1 oxidoreductase [Kineosporia sp. NBRC 101731]
MSLPLQPYTGDVGRLKEVFAEYPSGVAAIGARIEGEEILMIASSFTVGVSYVPPLCSVAIQKSSQTWPRLRSAPRIGVSALGAGHAASVGQLASRRRAGRAAGLGILSTAGGAVLLDGAATWLECRVAGQHEAGDHVIVLLEVVSTGAPTGAPPLVLHRGRMHQPVLMDL